MICYHIVQDIARQLVEDAPGRNVDVILGGGREAFTTVQQVPGRILFM